MSEENKILTVEELSAKFAELCKPELFKRSIHGIYGETAVSDLMRQYEPAADFTFEYLTYQLEHATSELRGILENKLIGENEGNVLHASDAYYEIARMLNVKEGGSVIDSVEKLQNEIHCWKSMHAAQIAESKWLKSETLDKEGEIEWRKKAFDDYKKGMQELHDITFEGYKTIVEKQQKELDSLKIELSNQKDYIIGREISLDAYAKRIEELVEENKKLKENKN